MKTSEGDIFFVARENRDTFWTLYLSHCGETELLTTTKGGIEKLFKESPVFIKFDKKDKRFGRDRRHGERRL